MKHWFLSAKRWSLAILSVASLGVGAFALMSCGGEGGPANVAGGGGGGGGTSAAFLALLPAAQSGATYVGATTCKTCHDGAANMHAPASKGGGLVSHVMTASLPISPKTTTPTGIYDQWNATMHASKGVTCENCHGPGSKHAAAPATTNILTFPNSTSPVVCAQCHGPIADDWATSAHSQLIADPVQGTAQSPGIYQKFRCIECHSGLGRINQENGNDIGALSTTAVAAIANDTLNSVPYVASCTTCHNPHSKTGNLSVEGEEDQLRHPLTSTDTSQIAPGTAPATYTAFKQQCAECHNGRGADGRDPALQGNTSRPDMHLSNQFNLLMGVGGAEGSGVVVRTTDHANAVGQCAHCHMPAVSHAFKTNYDVSCQPCHTTADASNRAVALKTEIANDLYALQARMESWATATFGNSADWDYTTNIPSGVTPPDETKVPIQIMRARHNYYFLVNDQSMGIHNAVYARLLMQVANTNLDSIGVAPAPNDLKNIPTNVKIDTLLKIGRQSKVGGKLD